jgi:hypothetical protein
VNFKEACAIAKDEAATVQGHVFSALRGRNLSAIELAALMQKDARSVYGALYRLSLRGLVVRDGPRCRATWRTTQGSKAPKDGRGHHPNSRQGRKLGGNYNALIKHKMARTPKPTPANALEAYWGWTPNAQA